MGTLSLLMLGSLLSTPPEPQPVLPKGLEIRWSGSYTEATYRPGVRAFRGYDVELFLYVIDSNDTRAEVALFSRIFAKPDPRSKEPPPGVVRIELARVDKSGAISRIFSPYDTDAPKETRPWPLVPLQGLPVYEAGVILELPESLRAGTSWIKKEEGRPNINWRIGVGEAVGGVPAVSITGIQETPNFLKGPSRPGEWSRRETAHFLAGQMIALKLERTIEHRDPGSDEFAFRSQLKLEQTKKVTYSGRLHDHRKSEALHAAAFTAELDRLLALGGRGGNKGYLALIKKIENYTTEHIAGEYTPYREASVAVRRKANAAAQGKIPTVIAEESAPILSLGRPLPEVTFVDLTAGPSYKLSRLQGKPVLLAYYQPSTGTAADVLSLCQTFLTSSDKSGLKVIPLPIGEMRDALKQKAELKLDFPLYDGVATYKTHGLESTPVLILLDSEGIIRYIANGWNDSVKKEIQEQLEKLTKSASGLPR